MPFNLHIFFSKRKCKFANQLATYKAACCIGRQADTDVWIMGEKLKLRGDGTMISDDMSSFIWAKEVFQMEEGGGKKMDHCPLPVVKLPLYSYALIDVVKALFATLHDNSMAGVFTIGGCAIEVIYIQYIFHSNIYKIPSLE